MGKKHQKRLAKESKLMYEQGLREQEDALLDRVLDLTHASVRDAKRNLGIQERHQKRMVSPRSQPCFTGRKSTINAFMDCNEDNGTCKACRSRLFGPR